jgi:hypothetical protein
MKEGDYIVIFALVFVGIPIIGLLTVFVEMISGVL